jgi:hypothetical protein
MNEMTRLYGVPCSTASCIQGQPVCVRAMVCGSVRGRRVFVVLAEVSQAAVSGRHFSPTITYAHHRGLYHFNPTSLPWPWPGDLRAAHFV